MSECGSGDLLNKKLLPGVVFSCRLWITGYKKLSEENKCDRLSDILWDSIRKLRACQDEINRTLNFAEFEYALKVPSGPLSAVLLR